MSPKKPPKKGKVIQVKPIPTSPPENLEEILSSESDLETMDTQPPEPPKAFEPIPDENEPLKAFEPDFRVLDRADSDEDSFLERIHERDERRLSERVLRSEDIPEPEKEAPPISSTPTEMRGAPEVQKPPVDATPEPKRLSRPDPQRPRTPRRPAAPPDPRNPAQTLPPESERIFLGLLDFRSPGRSAD